MGNTELVKKQLKILQLKYPDKDYNLSDPESISLEFRTKVEKQKLLDLVDPKICIPGKSHANKFEDNCNEIIKVTLSTDFFGCEPLLHPQPARLDSFSRQIRDITITVPAIRLSDTWESIKLSFNGYL